MINSQLKFFVFAFFIIISFVGFCQEISKQNTSIQGELIHLKNSNNSILYRGFVNQFRFNTVISSSKDSLIFKAFNCEVTNFKSDSLGYSFVISSNSPIAKARLVLSNILSDSLVYDFKVSSLPVPYIFSSGVNSTEKINLNKLALPVEISVAYEKEVTLQNIITVVKWEVQIKDALFHGDGTILSEEVLNQISRLNSGEKFQILTSFFGEDEVYRKRTTEFTIE